MTLPFSLKLAPTALAVGAVLLALQGNGCAAFGFIVATFVALFLD